MKMSTKYQLAAFIFLAACAPKKSPEASIDKAAYQLEIDNWDKGRVEYLKGPEGWLNLAGLFWLKEGINTFGSGEQNDIVFPEGKIDSRAGFFVLKQGVVTLEAAPKVDITRNGKPFRSGVVFHPDSSRMKPLEHGTLKWFIIKRDNRYGIRLRDLAHPDLEQFKGIGRFPVDPAYRVTADFKPADAGHTIPIVNVLGQTIDTKSPGTLYFSLNGQRVSLDVIDDGGKELFIIFSDLTNTKETYGAGRYLYADPPGADGKVILDFNKAYNPPCAFTVFATCPIPPAQNRLDMRVEAGELNYTGGHGRVMN